MNNLTLLSLIFGPGGILFAAFASWKALQVDRRTARVQEATVGREYVETALHGLEQHIGYLREENNELRRQAGELKDEVHQLKDELAFAEEDNRVLRRQVFALERRVSRTEGGAHE